MRTLLLASALTLSGLSMAHAQLIINGAMNTSVVVNVNTHNNVVPDGWTAVTGTTPDTFSPATTFFSYTYPTNSPAGFFTHISSIGGSYSEGLFQTVVGATQGLVYQLEFDQVIDLSFFANEGGGYQGWLQVAIGGGPTFNSTALNIPLSYASVSAWDHESFAFVAPSSSFSVQFRAISSTVGERIDMGLDNVSLTLIPEPSVSILIALITVVGFGFRKR